MRTAPGQNFNRKKKTPGEGTRSIGGDRRRMVLWRSATRANYEKFTLMTYKDFGDRYAPVDAREGFLRSHKAVKHAPDNCVTPHPRHMRVNHATCTGTTSQTPTTDTNLLLPLNDTLTTKLTLPFAEVAIFNATGYLTLRNFVFFPVAVQ
jgi:hypothetical protein